MALSEDGGYEYYHVNDTLKELAKDVADMQAENAKLRELVREAIYARDDADWASIVSTAIALGVEVDA